jgi:hypothetical protein
MKYCNKVKTECRLINCCFEHLLYKREQFIASYLKSHVIIDDWISWYKPRKMPKRKTLVHRLPTRSSAREYGAFCGWPLEQSERSEGYVCYWGKLACRTAWPHSSRNYAKRGRVHYTWKAYRRVHVWLRISELRKSHGLWEAMFVFISLLYLESLAINHCI